LHSVKGTIGAFSIEGGGGAMTRTEHQASHVLDKLSKSEGTIGLALSPESELSSRAQHTMARADSVRALLASDKTSFGRFRRDSTLLHQVADIRSELDLLGARMASTSGTLGRARADSALFQALAASQREMTLIMADMKRRPFRYVHF